MPVQEPAEDPNVTSLREARCLSPHPGQVTDPAFLAEEFSGARDAAQVKYEMVRRVTMTASRSPPRRVFAVGLLPGSRCPGGVGDGWSGQTRTPRRSRARRRDPGWAEEQLAPHPGLRPADLADLIATTSSGCRSWIRRHPDPGRQPP